MALRIGFDIDGVLADMEGALVREAERLFGEKLRAPQAAPAPTHASMSDLLPADASADEAPLRRELHLSDRERRQLWQHVCATEGFWESLEEIEPGSVARLAALVLERRWEIIFLTRRPPTAGETAQRQSQRWLEAHGFRLPSVYVVTASRGLIAAALTLDFVVDDTPQNCVDVAADSKARSIAVFRDDRTPPPALSRMGIHIVHSTQECLDLLVEIDSTLREEPPGVLERMMRTLGLKQPSSA